LDKIKHFAGLDILRKNLWYRSFLPVPKYFSPNFEINNLATSNFVMECVMWAPSRARIVAGLR